MESVQTKVCSRCQENKPFEAFRPHPRYRFGISGWCKACQLANSRDWAKRNRETPPPQVLEKFCAQCNTTKPKEAFGRTFYHADRLRTSCKACEAQRYHDRERNVTRHWWTNYRLRPAQVANMMKMQNGRCAICEIALKGNRKEIGNGKRPYIDHCHTTGKVRGIVCQSCNIHLFALDNPGWLAKAQAYISREATS